MLVTTPESVPPDGATLWSTPQMPKTVHEIERILREERLGAREDCWQPSPVRSSRQSQLVTVPGAPGKQVATGTLSSIKRASGIDEMR